VESGSEVAAKQWQAYLNDRKTPVRAVLGPADNLIVLAVTDLTGDLTRVEALRTALPDALTKLGPRHYVGVLSAQDGLNALLDPTPDRQAVLERVQNLAVGGKSGLLDTIEAAGGLADGMLRKAAVRVAVLYLTDSSISNYRTDYTNPVINSSDRTDLSRRFPDRLIHERIEQLSLALETCQAPIFILQLEARTGPLEEAYQNGLKKLAEETAGEAAFCRTPAEVGAALENLLARIRNGYVLSLEAPAKGKRSLRVRLSAAGVEKLSYRTRLVAR
jgi:hypothetical protein